MASVKAHIDVFEALEDQSGIFGLFLMFQNRRNKWGGVRFHWPLHCANAVHRTSRVEEVLRWIRFEFIAYLTCRQNLGLAAFPEIMMHPIDNLAG